MIRNRSSAASDLIETIRSVNLPRQLCLRTGNLSDHDSSRSGTGLVRERPGKRVKRRDDLGDQCGLASAWVAGEHEVPARLDRRQLVLEEQSSGARGHRIRHRHGQGPPGIGGSRRWRAIEQARRRVRDGPMPWPERASRAPATRPCPPARDRSAVRRARSAGRGWRGGDARLRRRPRTRGWR